MRGRVVGLLIALAACRGPSTPSASSGRDPGKEGESPPHGEGDEDDGTIPGPPTPAGEPWSRLGDAKPIRFVGDAALHRRLGVRSARAFVGDAEVLFVVYEFADEAGLMAAREELLALKPPPDALQVSTPPPFYAKAAARGRWLLVVGFVAEKPPSPEMQAARARVIEAWQGR